ncbi:hypothetical protein DXG01_013179 [Tephrocybe rancida]|nr:hypothetical protein DXG01_013179 [Tephrocybe rancida]
MPPGDGRSKERVVSHESRGSIVPEIREQQDSVEDEEGLSEEAGPAESDVLVDLEAIDLGTDTQSVRISKLITILGRLSTEVHDILTQSSAVSGTTLARSLTANTFVLLGDARQLRYRSGCSNLTRADSATLPRGESGVINSSYWEDRVNMELVLSPTVMEDVPPVPGNAELVYVPPQTQREANDSRNKKSPNAAAPEGNSQAPFSNVDAPTPAPSLSFQSLLGTSKERDPPHPPPARARAPSD